MLHKTALVGRGLGSRSVVRLTDPLPRLRGKRIVSPDCRESPVRCQTTFVVRPGVGFCQATGITAMPRSRILGLLACLLFALVASDARAFTYVVQPGDTLASIAERFYGQIQNEKLLVAANALDAEGGSPIVAGMRLEVPALSYHRVRKNETWNGLAQELLGAKYRSIVLSTINDSSPWLTPEEGSQIVVPYNLRVIVKSNEALPALAYKYLGDMKKAWELDHYNGLDGRRLERGDVVLVPITDLALTQEGLETASNAAQVRCSEGAGKTRETQLRVRTELPALISDVKSGRYAEAVSRGNRFLASGDLSKRTLATVHRQLLEAYVALDAIGLATAECIQWRENDPNARLDPILLSPKIIAVCERSEPAKKK